ncbi:spindle assembly abnormal protein 6 homolog [Saccoglossus kowalevskii]|uniref:Spindle assembly abnormal protein 6 homolog n=1 Tax=Saccoglossus kowalevskii TaxID=10224 RepID=A0ABM0GVM6_SACKO|nr:PREDICTED: spindle assembly abnormal protein 6 homolog isoform X1 [Saccoglossus kowalevskii]
MAEQLFNRTLAVTVRSSDRDDTKRVHIKITVELHSITTPLHKKELVVRLTDDTDPFFLYSLTIGDEDFQSLKAQQGLLVDFSAFPQKFIDLLQLCLEEESKESPKFLLQLITSGGIERGLSHLNVIETNPFKHLTHLSLKFVPGNDADVKKYLAACLKQLKDEKSALQNRLAATESELNHRLKQTQEALSERTVELDNMRAEWTSKASNLTARHTQEVTAHREKTLQIQTELQNKYEQERKNTSEKHQRILEQLEGRLAVLESTNKELTDIKYRSEATIRELQAKNCGLDEELNSVKTDLQNIRRQNTNLDSECHDRDKTMNQLRMRVAVLEQETKDKDQVITRTNDVMESIQEQKRKLEETINQRESHLHKMEKTVKASSEEVRKGNEIIKRLQGELKASMAKMKLKNSVTTQQEKLLNEKEQQVRKHSEELSALKVDFKTKEEENKKLTESLENTMQKLEESKQLLKTNENVINWLNKQVNEAQLTQRHGTFEMPPSTTTTSSFKPIVNPSMVHYNPLAVRKSNLQISTHANVPAIPEEISPRLFKSSTPPVDAKSSKPSEPLIDAKYLQKRDDVISIKGLSKATTQMQSSAATGHTITPPQHNSLRLSQAGIVPKLGSNKPMPTQPPLSSAYFPGSSSQQIQAQS